MSRKELYEAGIDVSPSAFTQQRNKLDDLFLFENILENFNLLSCDYDDKRRYKGYRVYAVDGTCVNLARDETAASYMKPTKAVPKGYNQLHVTPLFDIYEKTHKLCHITPQPYQDEIGSLYRLLETIEDYITEKTLIVGDRFFSSYNTIAYFQEHPQIDFLFRAKHGMNAMKAIQKLPMKSLDEYVDFTITTTQTKEDKDSGYIFINTHKKSDKAYKTRARRWMYGDKYHFRFRVVREKLSTGDYETLLTSLPMEEFTAEEIMDLYHGRWGIETAFRELKYTLGLTMIHGKKDLFASQEIYSAMIMGNFANRLINQVVIDKAQGRKYEYQVNHKMAVYIAKKFFRTDHADGYKIMKDIARYITPIRPDRQDVRNIKGQHFRGFVYRISA